MELLNLSEEILDLLNSLNIDSNDRRHYIFCYIRHIEALSILNTI